MQFNVQRIMMRLRQALGLLQKQVDDDIMRSQNFFVRLKDAFGPDAKFQPLEDISKYQSLRDSGISPEQMYSIIRKENMELFTSMDLMYRLYGIDSKQYKEVIVKYFGEANSLDEHLDNVASILERECQDYENNRPEDNETKPTSLSDQPDN